MNRRFFLRAGGSGLAGLALARLRGPWAGRAEAPPRAAEPIVIRSARLELALGRDSGLPLEFRLLDSGAAGVRFDGAGADAVLAVRSCDPRAWVFADAPARPTGVRTTASRAEFRCVVGDVAAPVASFTLGYAVDERTVVVSMRDVREHGGHELIEVALPRLVGIREEDGGGWLAHADTGGNVVALQDAQPGTLRPNTFWGTVNATLPVVMLGTERALCVQEVTSLMDGTLLEVVGAPGRRRAFLGTVKVHRVDGSRCYDMNTGPGTPRICGNARTPNLPVRQESSCRLDFVGVAAGAARVDWLDGARVVRARLAPIRTHLYDDALLYGILCDQPGFEAPSATFQQCEGLIGRIAALTGNARQIVHLWGWQYRGKDTGYPAVAEVDARLGGYDGLMRLMERARALNCTVTLSDNYDDAYRSSPTWDEAMVARRPDGELWQSRAWTGEKSYIIGLAKYMRGPGRARIRYTCERYRLPGTTHIDVLSYYPIRNDWDPAHPASGIENLVAGRVAVLDEYARRGVDVTSEALRYAFIGRISAFWNLTGVAPCPFGGEPIPLLPAVYRGKAVWGLGGRIPTLSERLLRTFFYNGPPRGFIRGDSDLTAITDLYYLMMVPLSRLHARELQAFRRAGRQTLIALADGAAIDLDWEKESYTLTADGNEIARAGATFCPVGADRLAFYATGAGELSAELPRGWDPTRVVARTLSEVAATPVPFRLDGRRVRVAVEARRPVILYRDQSAVAAPGPGAIG